MFDELSRQIGTETRISKSLVVTQRTEVGNSREKVFSRKWRERVLSRAQIGI